MVETDIIDDITDDCVVVKDHPMADYCQKAKIFADILLGVAFFLSYIILEIADKTFPYLSVYPQLLLLGAAPIAIISVCLKKKIVFTPDRIVSINFKNELTILQPGDIKKAVITRYWLALDLFGIGKTATLILVDKNSKRHVIRTTTRFVEADVVKDLLGSNNIETIRRIYPLTAEGVFLISILTYILVAYLHYHLYWVGMIS